MSEDAVKLYLTVCDTEEASNIVGTLTTDGTIISANITASSDVNHNFTEFIKDDTEVTITLTVEEPNLEKVMKKVCNIHDQNSSLLKINSDHPSAKVFIEWLTTKYYDDMS